METGTRGAVAPGILCTVTDDIEGGLLMADNHAGSIMPRQ
jgi:hypothetical protein